MDAISDAKSDAISDAKSDAIGDAIAWVIADAIADEIVEVPGIEPGCLDRKSTRLNSSHSQQSRMPSSA